MSKRFRLLPLTIMLIAGAITGVATFILNYKSTTALWITVGVLILFYIIGTVMQKVLLKFEAEVAEEEAKKAEEEGKVVEKEGAAAEMQDADSADKKSEETTESN